MSDIDVPHLRKILAVMEALGDMDPAHALVVLEDVAVGAYTGMRCGLTTMTQIATQTAGILSREETTQVLREHGRRPS